MSKKPKKQFQTNLWGFLNNVVVASMAKGQFPLALVAMVFVVMILKMPPQDVSRLMFQLEADISNGKLTGFLLSFLLGGGWFVHARWQRRTITSEVSRIGEEKSKLQGHHLDVKIESSES